MSPPQKVMSGDETYRPQISRPWPLRQPFAPRLWRLDQFWRRQALTARSECLFKPAVRWGLAAETIGLATPELVLKHNRSGERPARVKASDRCTPGFSERPRFIHEVSGEHRVTLRDKPQRIPERCILDGEGHFHADLPHSVKRTPHQMQPTLQMAGRVRPACRRGARGTRLPCRPRCREEDQGRGHR